MKKMFTITYNLLTFHPDTLSVGTESKTFCTLASNLDVAIYNLVKTETKGAIVDIRVYVDDEDVKGGFIK